MRQEELAHRAHLHLMICRCELKVRRYAEAAEAGVMASRAAIRAGEWDLLGQSLYTVATAFMGGGEYDRALAHLHSFLTHRHRFHASSRLEGVVWRSIGIAYQRKLESGKALQALQRALEWYSVRSHDQGSFNCLHDMIAIHRYLQERTPGHTVDPVAFLLQAEKAIVSRSPENRSVRAAYLYDRAANCLAKSQPLRAMFLALHALKERPGDAGLAVQCYLLLHRCTLAVDPQAALDHALAALTAARECESPDLLALAEMAVNSAVTRLGPKRIQELADQYASLGIHLDVELAGHLVGAGT